MPDVIGCIYGKGCWATLKKLVDHEPCFNCGNVRQLHAGTRWCGWYCSHCWLDAVIEEGEEICTNGACEALFHEAGLTGGVGNALLALQDAVPTPTTASPPPGEAHGPNGCADPACECVNCKEQRFLVHYQHDPSSPPADAIELLRADVNSLRLEVKSLRKDLAVYRGKYDDMPPSSSMESPPPYHCCCKGAPSIHCVMHSKVAYCNFP